MDVGVTTDMIVNFIIKISYTYDIDQQRIERIWKDSTGITDFINKMSSVYTTKFNKDVLNAMWQNIMSEFAAYTAFDEKTENVMQQNYKQAQATYNESEITLHNFGLENLPTDNIYNIRKIRLTEGENKFFLRQLINSYNHLKYVEKLDISPSDFHIVNNNLKNITFYTKKSPIGLLLAIYIYDKKNIVNMNKFHKIAKVKQGLPIDANLMIPINYIYKTYANDLVRYAKLFHDILEQK